MKTFPVRIKQIHEIAPQVRHFECELKERNQFDYEPGQFITLFLTIEGQLLRRSYSIASAPDSANISFAASYVPGGRASTYLFHLKPGDTLSAAGPFGRLVLPADDPARYVLIATGTGVTPYRAMLPTLCERIRKNSALTVTVLLGVRQAVDVLYSEDFITCAKTEPQQFSFYPHYSRETTLTHGYERQGYVQTSLDTLALSDTRDIVYLCGNPHMIDACYQWLQNHLFDSKKIRREKYISSN